MIRKASVAILLFVMFLSAGLGLWAEDKAETHNVRVEVMLVPLFAVDTDGNPVFNLEKDDLELYVNGAPLDIAMFNQFAFNHREEVVKEVTIKNPKVKVKQPSRAVFIVLDSVFNRFFGFRRSKKIAIDIIKNGAPDDMFIVLENTAGGGLRLIAGPNTGRTDMVTAIKKLKLPTGNWNKNLHLTREWNYESDEDASDSVYASAAMNNMANKEKYVNKMNYRNQAVKFNRSLSKFKYALRTVTRPKVVFLISEGIAKAAFKTMSTPKQVAGYSAFTSSLVKTEKRVDEQNESREMRLFTEMMETVKAINSGGSVLYTINPGRFRRDTEASGEMSLRFLAHESGGQYIAGSDAKKLVKEVRDRTAAYYELAFSPAPGIKTQMDIDIRCKRKNVKISSFKHTEKSKPYYRMEPVEKKLFALNMVTGGSWSRMMGKVVRIKYKRLRHDQNAQMIEINLPAKMKGRHLDIFSLSVDPGTKKVQIEMVSRKVNSKASLIVDKSKGAKEFFVLVEPMNGYCVYNQV
ncbi:MAG: hypothetical protein GY765_14020 [bacterium]|nr:hypothetical protein [bacterium]